MKPRLRAMAVILLLTTAIPYALAMSPSATAEIGGCPRAILCPDVWDPVICDQGEIFSNSCYAYQACATGCVPLGDTMVERDCPHPPPPSCVWVDGCSRFECY